MYSNIRDTLCLMYSNIRDTLCLVYSNIRDTLCLVYSNIRDTLCLMYSNIRDNLCLMYSNIRDNLCLIYLKYLCHTLHKSNRIFQFSWKQVSFIKAASLPVLSQHRQHAPNDGCTDNKSRLLLVARRMFL